MKHVTDPNLPPILTEKLVDFRRRVRLIKFVEGTLAALFGLALSFLFVFILDRFGETPVWLRTTLLIAGAAVPGLGLPFLWHRWVWRQRKLEDVARVVRRHFPRLGDQLLGIVELAHDESQRSARLVQAAISQAAEAVKDRDLAEAVPNPHYRRLGLAAGIALAFVVAAGALVPEASRNALLRWLTPWNDTERYTFAQVEELPENLVVPYAEHFELEPALKGESRWKPDTAAAKIPGQPKLTANREETAYPFQFPPQKEDTELRLSVGDDRERITVQPRNRPELTALTARVRLPKYLQYSHEPNLEIRGGTARLLEGAEVSWMAEASRELVSAKVGELAESIQEGKLVTDYRKVEESDELEFHWQDTLGLTPREPLTLRIQAVEDAAPGLTARRDSLEQVVLETEVIPFDLSVRDDFGIRRAGLEWRAARQPGDDEEAPVLKGEKIAAAGGPEQREIQTRATFSAEREGLEPRTYEIRAWAEDYLPERERVYSPAFVLHVLNPTDHAMWLTQQYGKWLEAARETYEREQQLHQTNKELRQLSPGELDRPENRRRVAKQAADEMNNAARLDNLTQAGNDLVEQGTRNPEFNADQLESWATLNQMLKDIAAKRMPSVADLLKESSNAQGGAASSPSTPGEQEKPEDPSQGGSQPSGPIVKEGETPDSSGGSKPPSEDGKPSKPVPGIADNESGFLDKPEGDQEGQSKPSSQGKFGLPSTTLGALPSDEPPPAQTPAQEKLDDAISEQRDLLEEFAKVSDQLADLLASLEASTFVKRLKAASRAQIEIAKDVNAGTLSAFGLDKKQAPPEPVQTAEKIADRAIDESETVYEIQSDLAAYTIRKPDMRFTRLLEEMKSTEVVNALEENAEVVEANLSGQSIVTAQYWADTLDRWAEEMVEAAQCESCSSGDKDSLPPEIVLKVMQALKDEMDLRDETRELEKSRSALETGEFVKSTRPLEKKQGEIAENVRGALRDIIELPNAQSFGKEAKLLHVVSQIMKEAESILGRPDTGPEAIAAETEAIELLLQAKRQNPGGGGGGGSNPGGGGGSAFASSAALANLGPGSDAQSQVAPRNVGQATGRSGREFPEEFRTGLDSYFNALEKSGAATP